MSTEQVMRLKASLPAPLANAVWSAAKDLGNESNRHADAVLVAVIKAWPAAVDEVLTMVPSAPDLIDALTLIADGINTFHDHADLWTAEQDRKHLDGLQEIARDAIARAR